MLRVSTRASGILLSGRLLTTPDYNCARFVKWSEEHHASDKAMSESRTCTTELTIIVL